MTEPGPKDVAPKDVAIVLDQLFRREAGQLVATLTRIFGSANLDLAESVVQDALVAAMQTWPLQGIPDNPPGWLMRVAKNKALDVVRQDKWRFGKEGEVTRFLEDDSPANPLAGALHLSQELTDDRLKLLFICCHPEIAPEAQLALALKTLFGLGVREIAAAFLSQETTIAQRLVRAKQRIKELGLAYELPEPAKLPERLAGAIDTLYLLFNEGYSAHEGDQLVRLDVCQEALRVTRLLASHPLFDLPEVHALAALMCFHASRLAARTDSGGDILLLKDQDRSLWDQKLVGDGVGHLLKAAAGEELTELHVQAGIAACHALAPTYDQTDWPRIVEYYDQLLAMNPSPVVALNRAAAIAMADGPTAGLKVLAPLKKEPRLKSYFLLHGMEGELLRLLGKDEPARAAFKRALACPLNGAERRFIEKRLARS